MSKPYTFECLDCGGSGGEMRDLGAQLPDGTWAEEWESCPTCHGHDMGLMVECEKCSKYLDIHCTPNELRYDLACNCCIVATHGADYTPKEGDIEGLKILFNSGRSIIPDADCNTCNGTGIDCTCTNGLRPLSVEEVEELRIKLHGDKDRMLDGFRALIKEGLLTFRNSLVTIGMIE